MQKVAVGIIMNDGKVLLCQRKRMARYPLKWEFPGGKVELAETTEQCLRRELKEELGIRAAIGKLYHQQQYIYPDSSTFDIFYYIVPALHGEIMNHAFESYDWIPIRELPMFDILEGNRDVVNKLLHDYENERPRKD